MSWVISAFEPFDHAETNSSLILLNLLKERFSGDRRFVFVDSVPVTFAGAWPFLREKVESVLEKTPVRGVVALGQAESRPRISLERVALNWIDTRIPDNEGAHRPSSAVGEGPEVLWSEFPWDQFPDRPGCERSYSAGTFVCNALMYRMLKWSLKSGIPTGFVHIPTLKSQTEEKFLNSPKMSDLMALEVMSAALEFLVDHYGGAGRS